MPYECRTNALAVIIAIQLAAMVDAAVRALAVGATAVGNAASSNACSIKVQKEGKKETPGIERWYLSTSQRSSTLQDHPP